VHPVGYIGEQQRLCTQPLRSTCAAGGRSASAMAGAAHRHTGTTHPDSPS